MAITTGVFWPGNNFDIRQLHVAIGNQTSAMLKGAFDSKDGKKQRVIIVEDDNAKINLTKLLCDPQTFTPEAAGTAHYSVSLGQELLRIGELLSQRIVTIPEYNLQKSLETGFKLTKLYIDGTTVNGAGGESIAVKKPKQSPLSTALTAGVMYGGATASIGKYFGYQTQESLVAGAIVGGLAAATSYNYAVEEQNQDSIINCKELAAMLVKSDLLTSVEKLNLLFYYSADKQECTDITNENERKHARDFPTDKQSHVNAMCSGLMASGLNLGRILLVSGYTGKPAYDGENKYQIRRSGDGDNEKSIRQKDAKHTIEIWP